MTVTVIMITGAAVMLPPTMATRCWSASSAMPR